MTVLRSHLSPGLGDVDPQPVAGIGKINRRGRPCLENDEVMREIEGLYGSQDWKRLYWSAYRRLFWAHRTERAGLAVELQHEAVAKVLGSRPVPVGVLVIAALHQAVRRTARSWREKRRRLESLNTATVRSANGRMVLAKDVV